MRTGGCANAVPVNKHVKMIAARRKGASVFLAPAGNCGDVRKAIPSGLNVVKVDTLHSAVQSLLAIEQGKPVPHC